MYATVGNLLHEIDPQLLIICEGLNYAGDLTGVASHPVQLAQPGKVVYSMHDYSWCSHPEGQSQSAYFQQMTKNGGYLLTEGKAPVWVGEFGDNASALSSPGGGGTWWANVQAWLKDAAAHRSRYRLRPYGPQPPTPVRLHLLDHPVLPAGPRL